MILRTKSVLYISVDVEAAKLINLNLNHSINIIISRLAHGKMYLTRMYTIQNKCVQTNLKEAEQSDTIKLNHSPEV